jgi:hypothetical protein
MEQEKWKLSYYKTIKKESDNNQLWYIMENKRNINGEIRIFLQNNIILIITFMDLLDNVKINKGTLR